MLKIGLKIREMVLVAIFAALTAVGAFIRIDIPFVPITLQVLFCTLSGVVLGPRLAALSQLVYILVGLCGFPVFAKGGGPMYILQPTFGYLIGFIAGAYVIGRTIGQVKDLTFKTALTCVVLGILVVYAIGVPYLYLVHRFYLNSPKSIGWALFYGFSTCIGGDLILAVIVAAASVRIVRIIRKSRWT